jgi:hypothetical protein
MAILRKEISDNLLATRAQFENLHFNRLPIPESNFQSSTHRVKAMPACRSRVYIQKTSFPYYPANVGMSTNKHSGFVFPNEAGGQRTESRVFPCDVQHQNRKTLHMKKTKFGGKSAYLSAVYVAVNRPENSGRAPGLKYGDVSRITGMPDFLAVGKFLSQIWVQPAVCIAVNADAVDVFHISRKIWDNDPYFLELH